MRKFNLQISVLAIFFFAFEASAQKVYSLHLKGVDKDSTSIVREAGIQTSFNSRSATVDYINKLPGLLQAKGYITASIDSVSYDSSFARIVLFMGTVYRWAQLDVSKVPGDILDGVGWREKMFSGKVIDFNEVFIWENRILNHLENTGYPFAKISLDSLSFIRDPAKDQEIVSAILNIKKGPLYKIDSIRLYGNAKLSNTYLQRYLQIPNGTIYNRERLININKKIRELTYIEEEKPADLSMLGTGSVLNLYLRQKKSSQVNAIIGFLPNNDQLSTKKLLITGEVNLLLKNVLGGGEAFGLDYQKLQVESQKLNFQFQYPYLFKSPVGLDFVFDLFKKDSSFVNLNLQLGALYNLNANESGKLFLQKTETIVSEGAINSPLIIQSRRLPDVADVSSINVGLDYEYNKTDYRLNPKKGTEISFIVSIGSKKIKKNNTILGLKDPSDPNFNFEKLYDTIKLNTKQVRVKATLAKYLPLRSRSTIKTALNAGMFESKNIFRNELFQLGGYRLLRGFDEQSQYLSSYAIATIEYRYLLDRNSFFYVLLDGGFGKDNRQQQKKNEYSYLGTGLGISFQTSAGIFNLAWAIGQRNDTNFNLQKSKLHFGFVNYF